MRWCTIYITYHTATLCAAWYNVGEILVIMVLNISSWSLHTVGLVALLLGNIDPYTIFLVGWWNSNKMLQHIHVTVS